MKNLLSKTLLPLLPVLFLAANSMASSVPETAQKKSAESKAVQTQVEQASSARAQNQRSKITEEAVAAIAQTETALKALDEGKTDEAIKALEIATGKLELILARDPNLALVPVDVNMITYDLYADVDTVKAVIKEAQDALDHGKIQEARSLLTSLASEVVISTTSIPLATYPAAIKAVSPMLDKGQTEKAKTALRAALDTLVVTSEVVPLPLLRSQYMLTAAEKLAEKPNRTDEENQQLNNLLKAAKGELKLAQVLGYGKGKDFAPLYQQIKSIKDKAAGGKSGKGWFDELKKKLADLF
ncbi:YfdX family protein [Thiolapillus sp.]